MSIDMSDNPKISSASIGIRHVIASDAAVLIAAAQASDRVLRPWASPPRSNEAFMRWFEGAQTDRDCLLGGFCADLVDDGRRSAHPPVEIEHVAHGTCDNHARHFVGCVHFSQIVRGNFDSAYMGFWANAPMSGRGLMTEVVGMAVDHAFGALGLHRIEANIQPGNGRSIALVKRLGFEREGYSPRYLRIDGVWRDHERWARLAS